MQYLELEIHHTIDKAKEIFDIVMNLWVIRLVEMLKIIQKKNQQQQRQQPENCN